METCYQCGKELIEKKITLPKKYNGKWHMIENVPALICHNCGEHYYDGPMMLRIEKMLESQSGAAREITVPVYNYEVA